MKPRLLSTARLSFPLASAIAALVTASSTQAAPIYWDGVSASWNLNTNWATASGADTPDPVAVPGAADDAIFNIRRSMGRRPSLWMSIRRLTPCCLITPAPQR